ncbi:MAG: histidinol-phosphate transaminase [Legionellales bacterium RIFCSPHIGHO2_12_FULL_35_11]|nr:MAG: histidinol-phosphate transaminase [Legionellales bacterium RIFCSPHIGHO2_12_FULL_35_11]
MYDFKKLTHPGIQSLNPYAPGKSIEEVAREQGITDIIKLASNENALGCSENVLQAIWNLSKEDTALYHTSTTHPFRSELAKFLQIDQEMLTLSNGSDLLICLLLICFAINKNCHILTHDYAFVSYEIQAKTLGVPCYKTQAPNFKVDIDTLINTCTTQTAIIFLANPNNPTGLLIEYAEIKRLLESVPKTTIVVLDEAYYEFAKDDFYGNSVDLINEHPNLVIMRTFSKAYGLAGLRLGYAISNEQITNLLYSVQLPFSVNIASLAAASAAIQDQEFIKKTLENTKEGLVQMQQALNKLGFSYLESHANFITIDCKKDGNPIFEKLQQSGIIVRPLHPYKMTNYLRVTIGTEEQNERFLKVFAQVMGEN